MSSKFGVIGSTIKVAFQMENKVPVLTKIDISQPLDEIKKKLFGKMDLPVNTDFTLQVSNDSDSIHRGMLITEATKNFIKVGAILCIIENPFNTLKKLLDSFVEKNDEKSFHELVDHAIKFIQDSGFADRIVTSDGFTAIYNYSLSKLKTTDPYLVKSAKLMSTVLSHKTMDESKIPSDYIENCKVLYLNSETPLDLLTQIYYTFYSLLYISGSYYNNITEFVNPDLFKSHFYQNNFELQIAVCAFINALFIKTPTANKMSLRNVIFKSEFYDNLYSVIAQSKVESLSFEQKRYIMMLEYIYLYPIYMTAISTTIKPDNQELLDKFEALYNSIYPNDVKEGIKPNYTRIGSKSKENPLEIFLVYPGSVTVDCFFYFVEKKNDAFKNYLKHHLDESGDGSNQSSSYSIFTVSMWIVKELLEYYHLYDQLSFDFSLNTYHPVIFSVPNSFYELFCSLLITFDSTWNEMSAKSLDLIKALLILKEQLKMAFNNMPKNLDDFQNQLEKYNYKTLLELVSKERSSGQILESKSSSVKWIKEYLKPTILDSLLHQRYSFMKNGTVFSKAKSKKGYIFCKLNPSHSAISYAESDDAIPIVDLPKKIEISSISQIITKSDPNNQANAPILKDTFKIGKKVQNNQQLGIVIMTKNQDFTLEMNAKCSSDYDFWVEGLNSLIGNQIITPRIHDEMSELLDLSVRISLIELDGIDIPEEPPRIPALPTNFDFYYKDY